MNNLPKVIFDTNKVYNRKATSFLAKNKVGLASFSKVAEIILPDMVVGELEQKYKRDFEEEKSKFLKTILSAFLSHNVNELNIDDQIKKLKDEEEINYSVIKLTDYSVLDKIKELALMKEPPFKAGVKEDPGFKDSYIYFTILEYLKSLKEESVFVCTHDATLKKALEKNQRIIVIDNEDYESGDYKEFIQKSLLLLHDEEFISRFNEGVARQLDEQGMDPLSAQVKEEDFEDYWININDNKIFKIKDAGRILLVEIDSGEVLNIHQGLEHKEIDLASSENYESAHNMINRLNKISNFLTHQEVMEIFHAYMSCSQVSGTIGFRRSRIFLTKLFESKKDILDTDIKESIGRMLK